MFPLLCHYRSMSWTSKLTICVESSWSQHSRRFPNTKTNSPSCRRRLQNSTSVTNWSKPKRRSLTWRRKAKQPEPKLSRSGPRTRRPRWRLKAKQEQLITLFINIYLVLFVLNYCKRLRNKSQQLVLITTTKCKKKKREKGWIF